MSLREIKNELELLCTDMLDELPKDTVERIRHIRRSILDSNQWIERTQHLHLQTMNCLYAALVPSITAEKTGDNSKFLEIRWQVNKADGAIEQALIIDSEARSKGIPRPMKRYEKDETDTWMEECLDNSYEGDYITSRDLYDKYLEWMSEEEPSAKPLTSNALGQKLSAEGFERTTKWLDGKSVKVWILRVIEV